MSATVWSSPRLVFRPAEQSDEGFLTRLQQDAEGYTQAAPFLARPNGEAWGKTTREWINSCMLGVLVCLPLPDGSVDAEPELDAEGREKPMPKPKPIGFICLLDQDQRMRHHRCTSIAITLAPKYRETGYGSEAIEWALRWGFDFAGLHRIEIGVYSWNQRAFRLYKRLGFVQEGVKREAKWFDGKWWDAVDLAMLEQEWREREAKKKGSSSGQRQ